MACGTGQLGGITMSYGPLPSGILVQIQFILIMAREFKDVMDYRPEEGRQRTDLKLESMGHI